MKRIGIYITFFMLFINQLSMNQLFKLPALVAHFAEHHGLDDRVGIIEFLSMHYWGQDLDDDDQEKDMKLPFKKVDECSAFQFAIPMARTVVAAQTVYILPVSQPVIKQVSHPNPAQDSLFRPPRA